MPSSKHHHSTSVRLARTSCLEFARVRYDTTIDLRRDVSRETQEMEISCGGCAGWSTDFSPFEFVGKLSTRSLFFFFFLFPFFLYLSFFPTRDISRMKLDSDRVRHFSDRSKIIPADDESDAANLPIEFRASNQTVRNEPSPRIKFKSSHDAVINHGDNSRYSLKASLNASISFPRRDVNPSDNIVANPKISTNVDSI